METHSSFKTFLFMLVLVVSCVAGWEYYWRSRGFVPTYQDDKVLWATKRHELDNLNDQVTVMVGGSRIKFDLDIPTWEKLTGEKAIQLAMVGTPGRLILRNLANNEKFKGNLILDVAESQFFYFADSVRRDKSAREALAFYYGETPAQKVSASINQFLESKLVFLEEGKFSLTSLLNDLMIPNRPGITVRAIFPKEFSVSSIDRQNSLTPMFLADSTLQNRQINIWMKSPTMAAPGIKGDTLTTFLRQTKADIDKIRARGGQVIFIRPPSNGVYLEAEMRKFPRQQYWDCLLAFTNTPGIFYADYPETAHLVCPEMSHLSPKDAVTYTSALVKILKQEKGWVFPEK